MTQHVNLDADGYLLWAHANGIVPWKLTDIVPHPDGLWMTVTFQNGKTSDVAMLVPPHAALLLEVSGV